MRTYGLLLVVTFAAFLARDCGEATQTRNAQPNVQQGGRTLSLSVAASDARRIVAATETGGLFQTFNGGKDWLHLSGLPNNKTRDVAVAFSNPNIIIATTGSQYRSTNDGGIWRSTDGGASWSQPSGWAPPPGPNCTARPGAYGISHLPLSAMFWVGTDCGIAFSSDNGATWANFVLDPSVTGETAHRVRSVYVINPTSSGVAAADRGLFYLSSNGWKKAQAIDTGGRVPVIHAFSAPYFAASNVFFHATGGMQLFMSTNGGANWSQITTPGAGPREAFVRVARSVSGDDQKFDVYFGSGVKLYHQSFSLANFTGSGTWTELKSDHSDPSDIVFDLERRNPLLLSGDGGVHQTTDKGTSWTLTGGGRGGFNALQISTITGQAVTGSNPHQDLYYGTQDNYLNASSDGGRTWAAGSVCCEGDSLSVDPTSVDHEGSGVTGRACGSCFTFITDAHFANSRGWRNAPDGQPSGLAEAPFRFVANRYLQYATNNGAMPPSFDGFLTSNAGSQWQRAYTLPSVPEGNPQMAGSIDNPTLYQPVQVSGSLPTAGLRYGLYRITNVASQPAVKLVDGNGTVAIGLSRTPISRRAVFGVDPKDPNHLIAANAQSNQMIFSVDGGDNWFPLSKLTRAVTDNGKYLFRIGELTLPTVVEWDPYDSCHILVGTMQNGVIRSVDGGITWKRVPGSAGVTQVSSFYFPPTGPVWVSSNGRGLWNIDRLPASSRCRFPSPPRSNIDEPVFFDGINGVLPFSGPSDPRVCPQCVVVAVNNGWITELELSGDEVRGIGISGGVIAALDRNGRELPLTIANRYQQVEGKIRFGRLSLRKLGVRRLRGLVLEGNRIRGVIARAGELSFAPVRQPQVFALNALHPSGSGVLPGETVQVVGTNFVGAARGGGPVQVLFDDMVVARNVQVNDDGSFSVNVVVSQRPGDVIVSAVQQDGLRQTMERTLLRIMRNDEAEAKDDR